MLPTDFVTEIGGLDIHFIHVRPPHADALSLIVPRGASRTSPA